jgi:predicted RNA-binding Zn ribbon-like protein
MDLTSITTNLRTEGHPAPGNLVLIHGFLNTWSDELGIEDFRTLDSTESWLRDTGLWIGTNKITSTQHQKLVNFRHELRAWILDKARTQALQALATGVSFEAVFDPTDGVSFRAAELGTHGAIDGVIGRLIAIISESQQNGTWDRLKCCDLPTCGWAFYDSTRSRTKRWCSMKTCGSRHKAREYYKRKR